MVCYPVHLMAKQMNYNSEIEMAVATVLAAVEQARTRTLRGADLPAIAQMPVKKEEVQSP